MNLKIVVLLLIIFNSFLGKADFVDQLKITVNTNVVYDRSVYAKAYVDTLLLRYLKVGDTLCLELKTDWDGHLNTNLNVTDIQDNNSIDFQSSDGEFIFIITEKDLDVDMKFTLNYGEAYNIKPWILVISKNYRRPITKLTIVQGRDSFLISESIQTLTLKGESFKLIFNLQFTDVIFLSSSFDSTSYLQVLNNESDSLICFYWEKAFFGTPNNPNRDLIITSKSNNGFNKFYAALNDIQFTRFDSLIVEDVNNWYGIRTVNSLFISRSQVREISEMKGSSIYIVYSPGLEKEGVALKLIFE